MPKEISFSKYIFSRFYNRIFSVLKNYVFLERKKLGLKSSVVFDISFVELSDFSIKTIRVNDSPSSKIEFEIIIQAEIEVAGAGRYDHEHDLLFPWFSLICRADLSKNLDDFYVVCTTTFTSKQKYGKPMSDTLIPYLFADKGEEVATDFLKRYYPEALKNPLALDTTLLAKRMGLKIEVKEITKDFSIFGKIIFADCDSEVYDSTSDKHLREHFSAGTIIVDPKAYVLRNLGSVNNTIVHECVHWDRHKKSFQLERLYNSEVTQLQCMVVGGLKNSGFRSSTDWMEWQACFLASKILMPISQFKNKAEETIRNFMLELGKSNIVDVIEPVIDHLATFFCVSRQAAKNRLVAIGYEEAIGAFTYIDGHYVKAHAFKRGTIKANQTFCISIRDAALIGYSDITLANLLKSGTFVYVDSHFCLNDEKYIYINANGNVGMTEYARLHMDECCLVFSLKIHSKNQYSEDLHSECVLCRDVDSGIEFITIFPKDSNDGTISQAKLIIQRNAELQKLIATLPLSFGDTLAELMKWSEITVEELSEKSLLNEKLIQRMRNNPEYPKNIECVIAVCLGMNLPPELSEVLIKKAGFSLRIVDNEAHAIYDFILKHMYRDSVANCNRLLETVGFKPIAKES